MRGREVYMVAQQKKTLERPKWPQNRAHEEMMMPHSPSVNHTWDDPHRNWAVITMAFEAQLLLQRMSLNKT